MKPFAEEGGVFLQENGRVGETETVNALLHVPHNEQILFPFRHRPENRVLHLVRILIFVHKDFRVASGDLLSGFRRTSVRRNEQLQRQMLLVGEIGGVQAQFFQPVGLRKVGDELQ